MKPFLFALAFMTLLVSCKNPQQEPQLAEQEATEEQVADIYKNIKSDDLKLDTAISYKTAADKPFWAKADDLAVIESPLDKGCKIPAVIGDLHAGTEIKLYKLDHKMAATASLMGFSGEIGKTQMLFIQDYIRYDYDTCAGKKIKVGVGLRCYIYVTSFKGKIGYTKLPGIAANVELSKATCSFELKSLGFAINGSELAEGLNTQGEYNVENFGKLAVSFNNVLRTLNADNKMPIRPVELP